VAEALAPYKKLYDNCSEFLENYDKWMNAKICTYDPEQIEQDVTMYYRNIVRLERTFVDCPAPLAIAIAVIKFIFCIFQVKLQTRLSIRKNTFILGKTIC